MRFIQRIGPDPHLDDNGDPRPTPDAAGCPDLWEMEDGNVLVIGRKVTLEDVVSLPEGVSCGSDEALVLFPRDQLIRASRAISDLS